MKNGSAAQLALVVIVVTVSLTFPAHSQQSVAASEMRSVWDGVFTDEQARRGQMLYHDACSACHGESLKGSGETPALAGNTFLSNWNGLPLGDLFERIRRTMPQDKPTRVNRQQKTDILTYLLSCNGFPAGKTELPHQTEFLNEIRFDAAKPDPKK
ncbi:MAG TPA: c-type cytochrome [Terriglobales bacterium]|jgi:cytochrome c|nr:c-type cytochrome [Terriglobales bacterium]